MGVKGRDVYYPDVLGPGKLPIGMAYVPSGAYQSGEDDEDIIKRKLDFTARFIETFTVRRSVNYKKFGQTSIKYTIVFVLQNVSTDDPDTDAGPDPSDR